MYRSPIKAYYSAVLIDVTSNSSRKPTRGLCQKNSSLPGRYKDH